MLRKQAKPALIIFFIITIIVGIIYPLVITGIAQADLSYSQVGT